MIGKMVSAILFLFFCFFFVDAARVYSADNAVVASGKVFELTEKDVERVQEYYNKTSVRTTSDEYRKGALKIKLFAHEAVVLGLDKDWNASDESKSSVDYWIKLSEAYMKYVMELYPVSEPAIVSYYRAFPERFEVNGEAPAEVQDGIPNADNKKKIRIAIINAQKSRILSEAEDKLKVKYDIKFKE